jgi:hypothetical protein
VSSADLPGVGAEEDLGELVQAEFAIRRSRSMIPPASIFGLCYPN